MNTQVKPQANITPANGPFFDAARKQRLVLPRCRTCGKIFYYPRFACPVCLSMDLQWADVSGRGTVYSYCVVRRPQHPAFKNEAPFILSAVKLQEGPMMISRLVNCAPEEVEIGRPVRAVFDPQAEDLVLPKFILVR